MEREGEKKKEKEDAEGRKEGKGVVASGSSENESEPVGESRPLTRALIVLLGETLLDRMILLSLRDFDYEENLVCYSAIKMEYLRDHPFESWPFRFNRLRSMVELPLSMHVH